jgi:methylase of polypeptide subunit release factors
VAVEHGFGQAEAVCAIASAAGYSVERIRDLAGIERVVVGRR